MRTLENTRGSLMKSLCRNPAFQPWMMGVAAASFVLPTTDAFASKRSDCNDSGGAWVAVWKCQDDCDNNGKCYNTIGGAAFPWPPPTEPVVLEALDAPASIVNFGVWNPDSSTVGAYAFAVAKDAPITTLSRTLRNWNSKAVSRAEWDSGFDFPSGGGGALGWAPPNTAMTFDTFFGPTFNQVLVFWADDAVASTPVGPGEFEGQFFTASATTAGGAPYVIFTDGDVLGTGQTLEMPPPRS